MYEPMLLRKTERKIPTFFINLYQLETNRLTLFLAE